MPAIAFDTIALLSNKAVCIRTFPNKKAAWNAGRDWLVRGIENTEKDYIIGPSLIEEVQIREHVAISGGVHRWHRQAERCPS